MNLSEQGLLHVDRISTSLLRVLCGEKENVR
jgi:hypothetical protein